MLRVEGFATSTETFGLALVLLTRSFDRSGLGGVASA
jgi:hypothetical protein